MPAVGDIAHYRLNGGSALENKGSGLNIDIDCRPVQAKRLLFHSRNRTHFCVLDPHPLADHFLVVRMNEVKQRPPQQLLWAGCSEKSQASVVDEHKHALLMDMDGVR